MGQMLLSTFSSKRIKATDFKFGVHVPRDSPDMIITIVRCCLECLVRLSLLQINRNIKFICNTAVDT